jgi:hypothetical protein
MIGLSLYLRDLALRRKKPSGKTRRRKKEERKDMSCLVSIVG